MTDIEIQRMSASELRKELRAARLRLDALSKDWNRHRDIEREWRLFSERTFVTGIILASVLVLAFLIRGA